MPVILYQFGNVPLFHTAVGSRGISLDLGRNWRNPKTELTGVGGSASYLSPTRSLVKSPSYKVTGQLQGKDPYSLQRIISELTALGGRRNMPIIGFFLENPNVDLSAVSNLLWIYTTGTLVDVDNKSDYGSSEDVWSYNQQPLGLTIEGDMKWKALSPWFWEHRDPNEQLIDVGNPNNAQVGPDNLFLHPLTLDDINDIPCSVFYKWPGALSLFDPTFWGLKYSNGILGGVGTDFTDFGTVKIFSDPGMWSADPSSIYAFTGLSPSGSISINVQRPYGPFQGQVTPEVSTLDLEQLRDDMVNAGYTDLFPDDIVYTGLLSPFPGFVMRDGERLTGFAPRWGYVGSYPGETSVGVNTISFSSEETTGQVAYLHDFGML